MKLQVLMVLSSADRIPGTDRGTGTWLEELAAPYYTFLQAGARLTVASLHGGPAPIDPTSQLPEAQTEATRRFLHDAQAGHVLANTRPLADIEPADLDAVYFCGGLGPVFDLTDSQTSIELIEFMDRAQRPIAAVCHAVAVLFRARSANGQPLVRGRKMSGFSNTEERAVNEPGLVPWLVEDELRRLGAVYSRAADWQSHVVADKHLFTGQNPASAAPLAEQVMHSLGAGRRA